MSSPLCELFNIFKILFEVYFYLKFSFVSVHSSFLEIHMSFFFHQSFQNPLDHVFYLQPQASFVLSPLIVTFLKVRKHSHRQLFFTLVAGFNDRTEWYFSFKTVPIIFSSFAFSAQIFFHEKEWVSWAFYCAQKFSGKSSPVNNKFAAY